MIKVTPATNIKPVLFEWDEQFKVQIQSVPQSKVQKLVKSNEETNWNKKHEKKTETDWLKFGKDFMRVAIVGWVGMTYRHLLDICQPIDLEPAPKLDDLFEFNAENLEVVVNNYRTEFSNFVAHATTTINEVYAEQKKKELENL